MVIKREENEQPRRIASARRADNRHPSRETRSKASPVIFSYYNIDAGLALAYLHDIDRVVVESRRGDVRDYALVVAQHEDSDLRELNLALYYE